MNANARLFAATIVFLLASVVAHAAGIPVITSISPSTVYINGPAFTLTVNGTGFVAGDTIYLNYDAPLTTTYVSSTKLTAAVPASDLTDSYTYDVFVENSLDQQSNSEPLSIVDPTPTLQSISPPSVVAASAPSPLTITGSNFMSDATVQLNGKTLPTIYINAGQLQITPTKSDLATPGIVSVTVKNPLPVPSRIRSSSMSPIPPF